MTTLYKFKAYYTDAGVGTAQDPAPTCTVINMADDSKLADAQATTASTNMPGLYSYEYSGADGLDCVAWFKTTDTGCDVKELASYVSEKITTNLNADVAGVETKLDTVDANVDAILADTGTDGVVLKAAGLADDAVNEIVDQVWNEAIADHTTATTFGGKNQKVVPSETINDYKADVSGLATAAALTTVDNEVGVIDGIVDAIKAKTDNLPADPADDSDIDAQLAAIKAETALIVEDTGTTIPATLTTIDNEIAVIDGIVDAILDDTGTTGVLLSTSALTSIFDDETIVGTYTFSDLLKIMAAALAGKATGGGTTTVTFRGVDDTSDVIVATVDANGNRSAVTLTV